ncbi:uncharacterized protein TrAFT101_006681 [Trichoderma asperellum]|uniref:uncharacterized protein n=1 Tax=Trichoderma asperellum TaxID=101201 RepID=UPI003321A704|nr:hypothetical protein TrAFT101_006681 [Trichoderma asperellum]
MQAIRHYPSGGTEKLKFVHEDVPEIDDEEAGIEVWAFVSKAFPTKRSIDVQLRSGLFRLARCKDGMFISIKDREALAVDKQPEQKVIFFIIDMDMEQLTRIGNLVDEGHLRPVMDSVYDFGDVRVAFRKGRDGARSWEGCAQGPKA